MRKKLLLLALLGFMITGCGSTKELEFSGAVLENHNVIASVADEDVLLETVAPSEEFLPTEEEVIPSVSIEQELSASVDETVYKLTINGMVYEGTVDEIVDCLPSNEGIYVFTISEGIANSHYVVDSASAAKDAILRYVKSKANEEAENNIEQQDSEDLHASVDKFIADCMTYVDAYLDNGYTITYYSVRTDDSKKINSFAITSGDTTYLVSDSGIYNRVFVSNVDELNAIDKLSSEVGSIVWKEYNFGEKDWSAYMQELEEAELASKESFTSDKVVRQSAVDTLMEEKGYSAAPIGYRYYDTQILSILMKTDTGELYLYDLGTYKPLSNWSSRFNFSNEEEFCNVVSNNSVTDTFSSEEDYIWEIYEQIDGN